MLYPLYNFTNASSSNRWCAPVSPSSKSNTNSVNNIEFSIQANMPCRWFVVIQADFCLLVPCTDWADFISERLITLDKFLTSSETSSESMSISWTETFARSPSAVKMITWQTALISSQTYQTGSSSADNGRDQPVSSLCFYFLQNCQNFIDENDIHWVKWKGEKVLKKKLHMLSETLTRLLSNAKTYWSWH